jgi:uncharacterized protein
VHLRRFNKNDPLAFAAACFIVNFVAESTLRKIGRSALPQLALQPISCFDKISSHLFATVAALFNKEIKMSVFHCSKCGHNQCETGEIRASGGGLSSVFDIENRRFSYMSCANCTFTEFYKTDLRGLTKIFDFLVT